MGTTRPVQTEGPQQCEASGCLGAMETTGPCEEDSQAVGRLQRTSEIGTSHIIPIFWMTPLEWLEKNMHISVSESLRQSLPLPALQQDAGTNVTPVLSRSAGTWMTPPALLEKSTNTSAEWFVCAKDSAAETDSLLWHCSREHLSVLSRAELEGRLESTLIIIEALSCQLRDWQQSQGPVPHLGPAEQRDVLTQTDIAHPKVEEQLYHDFYLAARERLMALQRNRKDEQALHQELEEAREVVKSWTVESQSLLDSANISLKNLQEDRRALKQQQDQMRALLSLNQSVLDKVATKLKSCLAEQDEMRSRAAEALEAKDMASTELELVSSKLEEVTAELQNSLAQVDQLTVANSRLGAELSTLLRDLASLQCERDELQEKHAALSEEMAQLTREQALLRQEHDRVRQELREMTECREFIDQENRVCREQLTETERELKATLAVLRERSMQFEDQKDAYQHLQKERDTLCEALDCSKVEALGLQLNRDKLLKSALELAQTKGRLLDLTDVLQAALQGEAAATSRSIARTPHSMPGSFVGSVLKAVAGKGTDEEAAGGWCTSAEIPAEIEESLWETALELRTAVSQLVTVSSQSQKATHNEIQELQAQISQHQHQLESLESRLQAEIDARDANIAKLNKTLQVRFQAEKELQDIMQQQEKQMLQLIDRSGEVTHLKAEVSHLQHLLRRVETEARVLWEEVRGREPSMMTLDAEVVQEKVLLRQEVNKLRELLLETQRDNQEQRRIQEGKLHQTQTLLRSHEAMQEKIKEALSSIPAAVTASSQELQNLLQYFGLKLREGDRDSGDAL